MLTSRRLFLVLQWPPVVKSVMEPMNLAFARQPEPANAGAVFCDEVTGSFNVAGNTCLQVFNSVLGL